MAGPKGTLTPAESVTGVTRASLVQKLFARRDSLYSIGEDRSMRLSAGAPPSARDGDNDCLRST